MNTITHGRGCYVHHTITVESHLQLMRRAELKCLKPHTDVAKNMQSMVAIYIPGFCTVHPAFNSGPKWLMTRQNLNVYFCYLKRAAAVKTHEASRNVLI